MAACSGQPGTINLYIYESFYHRRMHSLVTRSIYYSISMSQQLLLQFIEAINNRNPSALASLMTDDHTFIDAQGSEFSGRDNMKAGWEHYFNMFPDYNIEVTDMLSQGDTWMLCGYASGSYKGSQHKEKQWKIRAAWKAVVEDNKIKLWQVFADMTDVVGSMK